MSCPPPDWATDGRLQSFKLSVSFEREREQKLGGGKREDARARSHRPARVRSLSRQPHSLALSLSATRPRPSRQRPAGSSDETALPSLYAQLDGDDASDEGSPTPSVATAPTPAPPTARRGPVRVFRTGRAVGRASTPPLPPPTLPEEVSALAHLPAGAAAVNGGGEAEEGSLIVADGALETPDGRPSAAALAAHRAAGGHAFVGPVDREQVSREKGMERSEGVLHWAQENAGKMQPHHRS